mgnify:CR=1 FL=1
MAIQLKIITPERVVLEEKVDSVTIPTTLGEITVLPNHIPLVAILATGVMTLRSGGAETHLAASGGFAEVLPESRVNILADSAERAEELSWEKVEEAKEAAQKILKEKRHLDESGQAAALGALEREIARLKAIRRRGAHGRPHAPHVGGIEGE